MLQAQHERDTQNSVFEVNTVLMEFLTGKISTKNQQDERTARALSKDGIMKNTTLSCLGAGSRKESGNTHFAVFKILVYYLFTRAFHMLVIFKKSVHPLLHLVTEFGCLFKF